ncbi:Uncharacterized phage protein gp47/JayE [Azotobacter beijerinckii]|uniref:Uncharacterized phage protein gp47/JayE n=1 Tax=Azotobacter beijerinckii TaxID=170623 RepID=A0A1H6X0X7_9GAMM|nr:baseplate J/gp47 family protein [Azotobacter beijerinckii]SEJ21786.1 Uncharacterized phage protein gp47/JayE [Azotobacter beijerinckii]
MPYARPALSDLRAQVAADITAGLPTADGLLRFSNLSILGTSLAGLAHLQYGFLDWIAKQACPYTSTEEFLEAWAALKKVYRKTATAASGQVTFLGATPGALIDAGTEIVRSDSMAFHAVETSTVAGDGSIVVAVAADSPGEAGNTPAGSLMTLGSAITGIPSSGAVTTAITGGADQELDQDLFKRMLEAYQKPPNGGSKSDYEAWALEIPGVTRAWCNPNGFGAGTVVVYIMLDDANADYSGFPQGTNGISASDNRVTSGNLAAGDQLAVADGIFSEQPVTAMVYVCGPIPLPVNFTISGLSGASSATRAAIASAIREVLNEYGEPLNGSIVPLSAIESAIAAISGTAGFVITAPTDNLANTLGYLPILGTVTYS